jgi:hypothetical protein
LAWLHYKRRDRQLNHECEYPGPNFTIEVKNLNDDLIREQARVIMIQAGFLIWESLVHEEYAMPA